MADDVQDRVEQGVSTLIPLSRKVFHVISTPFQVFLLAALANFSGQLEGRLGMSIAPHMEGEPRFSTKPSFDKDDKN